MGVSVFQRHVLKDVFVPLDSEGETKRQIPPASESVRQVMICEADEIEHRLTKPNHP